MDHILFGFNEHFLPYWEFFIKPNVTTSVPFMPARKLIGIGRYHLIANFFYRAVYGSFVFSGSWDCLYFNFLSLP